MNRVLSLDPGDVMTGFCLIDRDTLKPVEFGKIDNQELAKLMENELVFDEFVAERIASYGMPVGVTTFRTCEWIGRFVQIVVHKNAINGTHIPISYIYRKDEKLHICGDSRAKDANIRRSLIDRFATVDMKNGKGSKNRQDFFYGFKSDIWQSYSTGLTYIEAGPSEVEKSL